jgi:hypothetical protein
MPLDLSALEAEVTRNESVDGSASLLLKRLFDEVEANKNNPAAIQAIVDRVRASNDALTAAVSANTPSEPPPVEPPVEPSGRRR